MIWATIILLLPPLENDLPDNHRSISQFQDSVTLHIYHAASLGLGFGSLLFFRSSKSWPSIYCISRGEFGRLLVLLFFLASLSLCFSIFFFFLILPGIQRLYSFFSLYSENGSGRLFLKKKSLAWFGFQN